MKVQAGNYWDGVFKKDSTILVIRETQLGKNFFNTTNNNYFAYSSKLGMQMNFFQAGVCSEREYNFTNKFSENYIQRNKSFGAFFGIELPVSNKIAVGLVGTASFYKPFIESLIYSEKSSKLFEIYYRKIYQAQLRLSFKLNQEFSLLGTVNFNLTQEYNSSKYISKENFLRVNLGFRYTLNSFNSPSKISAVNNGRKIVFFAGSNLEWKNEYMPDFIGVERKVQNDELLDLVRAGSEISKSKIFPLFGLSDKKNNMLLLGFNLRDFTHISLHYQPLYSKNWEVKMYEFSSKLALEFNLISFSNEKIKQTIFPFYPFYRLTATYNKKTIHVNEGWDIFRYATDDIIYIPQVDNNALAKSLEINNSLGLAMKLKKLYLSSGFNVFNRTYGEIKYQSTITRKYYENIAPQNYIESKTETMPALEAKGWLKKPIDPINVFFTIGLIL